jgi:dTDP-4-amino-4,6-dideoxygalactose transaminase
MCSHEGTPWFVDVYVEDRDSLAQYLAEKGIGTRKMYPLITTQPPFLKNPTFGDNTLDKKYSTQGLWLPSFFKISDKQIDFIAETINEWRKINAK